MQALVEQILRSIPVGRVFDSHFIIQRVIESGSDTYIRFASQYSGGQEPTLTSHQQIGHVINSFSGTLVQRMPADSWSQSIHGSPSPCALWRRI